MDPISKMWLDPDQIRTGKQFLGSNPKVGGKLLHYLITIFIS